MTIARTFYLLQSFIPRTLDQVKDFEKDIVNISRGKDTEGIYYQTITGLKPDLSGVLLVPTILENSTDAEKKPDVLSPSVVEPLECRDVRETNPAGDESTSDEDASSEDDDASSGSASGDKKMTPADRKAARKENKKKVKEEKREARKTKVPKAVKKRKKKLSKDRSHR